MGSSERQAAQDHVNREQEEHGRPSGWTRSSPLCLTGILSVKILKAIYNIFLVTQWTINIVAPSMQAFSLVYDQVWIYQIWIKRQTRSMRKQSKRKKVKMTSCHVCFFFFSLFFFSYRDSAWWILKRSIQGCQTLQGPHQHYSCQQRARVNVPPLLQFIIYSRYQHCILI